MGLQSALQAAAKAGFKAISELQEEIVFKSRDETYSVATGGLTDAGTTTKVKVLFTRYKAEERTNASDILFEDYRVLFPATDITFTPETQDTFTKGGDSYEVIRVDLDTAQAMYSLQVRKQ